MKVVNLLGIHGAGKGEQMKLLLEKGYVEDSISTGEAFRQIHDPGSRYHVYEAVAAPYEYLLAEGKYLPDSVALEVVKGELEKDKKGGLRTVGMEGFPRTLEQARALLEVAEEIGEIDFVFIYLDLPDEIALERLANRGTYERRSDDAANGKRIALYHEVTDPMIDYLRSIGKVVEVDDKPAIEVVHKTITDLL